MPVRAGSTQQTLAERGYHSDPAQLRAVEALSAATTSGPTTRRSARNALKKLINRPPIPRGVYMYGGVGRGKSFLMDCFFNAVPLERKTRLHFHEFMREVHRELARSAGHGRIRWTSSGARIAQALPADLLRRVPRRRHHRRDDPAPAARRRCSSNGVGFVTTSNFQPDDLYPNGLHRDRILPAIALLKDKLEVISVDAGIDYRRRTLEQVRLYHTPLGPAADAAMREAFERLAETRDEDPVLHIEHREIRARRSAGGVVWFDFKTLCGGPRSQNDYLEIATQFHTVLLSDVPQMPPRLASEARRFTWLVDVLYDRRVKLIMSAEVPPEALYTEGPLAHEFPRTVSRLNEMQSPEFLALGTARRRHVADMRLACFRVVAAAGRWRRAGGGAGSAGRNSACRARAHRAANVLHAEARFAERRARMPDSLRRDGLRRRREARASRNDRLDLRSEEMALDEKERKAARRRARRGDSKEDRGGGCQKRAAQRPGDARAEESSARSATARGAGSGRQCRRGGIGTRWTPARPPKDLRPLRGPRNRHAAPRTWRAAGLTFDARLQRGRGRTPGGGRSGAMPREPGEAEAGRCRLPLPPSALGAPERTAQPSGSTRTSASDRLSPAPRARWRALPTSISVASRGGSACTIAPSSRGVK